MARADPSPSPPAETPRPRRRTRLPAALALAALLLVAGAVAALLGALRSEAGSAWLLGQVPGLRLVDPKGALLGDFSASRIELAPGSTQLVLQGAGWRGLRLEWRARAPWLRVAVDELRATRIDVQLAPASKDPTAPPASLRLPIELEIRALRVQALHVSALGNTPVRELAAQVHLGAEGGALHRVDGLAFGVDRLRASGSASLRADAPMALSAAVALAQQAGDETLAWSAQATLAGPLAAPRLHARLRAAADSARPAQSLDLNALLRPFESWPLGELQANARAVDLAALNSAWPSTALDADATAETTAIDQPAELALTLRNRAAGRWSDAKLPLREARLGLRARPDQPETIELTRLDAELGTLNTAAGRITGQGRWTRARWQLEAALDGVQPSLLDARAPAMRLGGPLRLAGDSSENNATVDIAAELSGALAATGPARAVQLDLDARVGAQRLELRRARARAGAASATLAGSAQRAGDGWQAAGRAALIDFDPQPWWPGRDDSPWRQGPHRVNANAEFDLVLPAEMSLRRLAELRGSASLDITKSQLAGVPLNGKLSLRHAGGAEATAAVQFDLDGNRLRADGRLDTRRGGAGDAWDLLLDAPALARLAPLWRLLRPAQPALAGAASATARLSGRWPTVTTSGQAEASGLRIADARAERVMARWQLGSAADAPVELHATLAQAAFGDATLAAANLDLNGTARAHRLELRATSVSRPPAWVDAVQAPANGADTVALLNAQGGLIDIAPQAAAGWRGTIETLSLAPGGTGAKPWLRTRDVTIEATWSGQAPRLAVQPGRAELLGGALRWQRLEWQAAAATAPMRLDALAEIEPFAVAPLLARLQPEFGWGGDLTISGRIDVRSAPEFRADVVLERARGDLSVTDESRVTQALGLSDLRLGLNVAGGVWSFTQALAGQTLGVAAGAVVARTSAQAAWPAADTPIEGVLELRVANLGTWGTWVPAGWRLGGALHVGATIAGRFGAPEYTGTVTGEKLSVRNFVQGVNVSDGEVAIALRGESARIERFEARAGSGRVSLEGSASLGEAPRAELALVAEKFQVLGRVDRRIVASGQGRLKLDAEALALDGEFGVDEGLIDFTRGDAPALSDDVEVLRRGPNAAAPAAGAPRPAATKPARKVALDLRVKLGERLRVRGRGLDTGLVGELRLSAPGGALAVAGTVSASGGTYAAYGQKLTIDRGDLVFNGPAENPRLDIEATRPNLDLRVGVIVSGTAQNPRVRLFSEPELSEVDKLSYLVLGRASEGLGRTDTALLQRAAMALLAGEGESLTGQLTQAIGLDELSLRQTDGEVRETVVSLGKQLSRRWYVGYERGLNATAGTWQLVYRIAQRFTLRAQSGLDNSLDLIWTWRWQ